MVIFTILSPAPAPPAPHLPRQRPPVELNHHTGSSRSAHWPPPLVVPSWIKEEDIPEFHKCPITFALMTEPASTSWGHSYDRSAISQWLDTHHVCPKTQMTLHKHMLTPNLSLRSAIEDWIQEKERRRS